MMSSRRLSLKLKIAELSGALANAQIALVEAQREITQKDATISKLEANLNQWRDALVECRGFYYRKKANGKPQGRPYCPNCLAKGHLMMTVVTEKPGRPLDCPTCEASLRATEYLFEGE
jgi:hypothetical protein